MTPNDFDRLFDAVNWRAEAERKKNMWRALFIGALLVIGLQFLAMSYAKAHSWYEPECCSDKDCEPIPPETVQVTPSGYLWAGILIPFAEARISMDRDYHVCRGQYTGILIQPSMKKPCFYAPMGGA